ncbi:hypothetical protein [Deinococcus koreensis]|uniref:Uncharacterized protein n=1 Tax=Deinococcus koreensis TaxID=2054903 RepID=A0A2K3UYL9_9DEIO|nr:hypothetical protein [Deinococcus koreensis]PNY81637.1 hypothetical protein CVO96_09865 [Deinococcus koreensis]
MTFPEDMLAAPARIATAPNAALGYLLNIVLPGAGFTYIGRWGWHLGWFAVLCGLNVVAGILAAATGTPIPLILPLIGFVVMLVHFGRVYAEGQDRHFRPQLERPIKLALILGHAFLGFMLTGILAAVLIPNLLAARTKAVRASEQAVARRIQVQAAVAQLGGTLANGSCPLETLSPDQRATIERCTVETTTTDDLLLTVDFTSGRTVSLP